MFKVYFSSPVYYLGREQGLVSEGLVRDSTLFWWTNRNNISAGNISNQGSTASESLVEDDSGHDRPYLLLPWKNYH